MDFQTDIVGLVYRMKEETKRASQVAQWYRARLPTPDTWIQSLGREDPLEKEMATLSSVLAWEIPWTEEPGGLRLQSRTRPSN